MSDLDLTEAVEAGMRATEPTYPVRMSAGAVDTRRRWTTGVVEAAAPIIERQVRERVADAIFADEQKCAEVARKAGIGPFATLTTGRLLGLQRARDIAKGERGWLTAEAERAKRRLADVPDHVRPRIARGEQ